jgi:hypothetical protein
LWVRFPPLALICFSSSYLLLQLLSAPSALICFFSSYLLLQVASASH